MNMKMALPLVLFRLAFRMIGHNLIKLRIDGMLKLLTSILKLLETATTKKHCACL